MNWDLIVAKRAQKELVRFPQKDQERITDAIDELKNDPFAGDIQKIKGEERVWRRRVGNYRIFYEVLLEMRTIFVFRVERRTSTTY